jgi:hypothetical protein
MVGTVHAVQSYGPPDVACDGQAFAALLGMVPGVQNSVRGSKYSFAAKVQIEVAVNRGADPSRHDAVQVEVYV